MTKCRWWNRWWHRRLRRIDVAFMLPSFRQQAEQQHPELSHGARELFVQAAWALFTAGRGQEHWRCECAATGPAAEGE